MDCPVACAQRSRALEFTLLDPAQIRLRRDIPAEVARIIADGEPIPGLIP